MPTDVAESPGKVLVEALLNFRESRIAYCEKHPAGLVGTDEADLLAVEAS